MPANPVSFILAIPVALAAAYKDRRWALLFSITLCLIAWPLYFLTTYGQLPPGQPAPWHYFLGLFVISIALIIGLGMVLHKFDMDHSVQPPNPYEGASREAIYKQMKSRDPGDVNDKKP